MRPKTIKAKIIFLSCLITIIGFSTLAAINIRVMKNQVSKTLLEKAIMEVGQIGKQAEILLDNGGGKAELQKLVDEQVANNHYIAYSVVIDTDVTAVAHSDHAKIGISYADDAYTVEAATQGVVKNMEFYADVQETWVYDIMVPIHKGNQLVGAVDVGIYQNEILDLVKSLSKTQLLGIICLEIIFACLLAAICQGLLKHLHHIVNYLDTMAKGDFTLKIEESILNKNDEIGLMGNALSNMRISLSKLIASTAQEVSKLNTISDSLKESAEETNRAANHITESMVDVVDGNKDQTELSTKTTVMSEEIHIGMERITENIQAIAFSSNNSVMNAEKGNKLVNAAIEQMQKINVQVTDSSNQIQMLGEKSKEIENITAMIAQIAQQTNLLALNASIEAARAGEHGKGFAVVADEVRLLAEQSTKAADDIKGIISDIQDEIQESISAMNSGIGTVKEGLELVTETGEAFEVILKEISEVSGEMESVSAVTEEVNAGTQNVLENIQGVTEIVTETSRATEKVMDAVQNQEVLMQDVAQSSEILTKLSKAINDQINVFKI